MKEKIYLDYAATTPVDERVINAMMPYFTKVFGNPSSVHYLGQLADAALVKARHAVATMLNCHSSEVIFTSGGTESDNMAVKGIAIDRQRNKRMNHILISPIEHPAVKNAAHQMQQLYGFDIEYLPVDQFGMVSPDDIRHRIRRDTALVSVIYASNELGTINPIADISKVCQEHEVPLHTDAVQAAAHLPLNIELAGADLFSLTSHKFYGPKGVGVLIMRQGNALFPLLSGGGQEASLRPGTQNIPGIVGFTEALHYTRQEMPEGTPRLTALREMLVDGVLSTISDVRLTGHPGERLPNHVSLVIKDVDANTLLMLLDVAGFACSSGSACKAGSQKPSEVLMSIGITQDAWNMGALRVTMGRFTTKAQVESFVNVLPEIVSRIRKAG